MPTQSLPRRRPGPASSGDSLQDCHGSARCRERATFVSAKVAKTIARGHDDLADVVSARLPSALAERRPRRTRASLRSNMRRLLRRSAARLGVMHGAGKLAHRRPSIACHYANRHPTRTWSMGKCHLTAPAARLNITCHSPDAGSNCSYARNNYHRNRNSWHSLQRS